jgi:branched-chain amino acid transport system permease protein
MVDVLLTQTINGLMLGMIYVLVAVGLSITFGMLGIINFAHGAFFALGAYTGLLLFQTFGWWAIWLAPLIVAGFGMALERILISKLYGREPLTSLVVTFALGLLIEAIIRWAFGPAGHPFATPSFLSGIIEYGPILVTRYRVAVLVCSVAIVVGLWLFLTYTSYGHVLQAGSRDPEMVEMLGINFPLVQTLVFGLGCSLAAIAGVLAAPIWAVVPSMGAQAIMPAFVIVAIGGLGSFSGAVVSGLLVGVVTTLTVQFKPEAAAAAMYILMFVMLLLLPRGILGRSWERVE